MATHPEPLPPEQLRAMTRRAFASLGAGAALAGGFWWWLRTQPDDAEIPWPLRAMHRFNEQVGRALFSHRNLAPDFPSEAIVAEPRINGAIGQPERATAMLRVDRPDDEAQFFSVAGLLADLPRTEHTTELKCIEGWSQVVHWSGVRFADAAEKFDWPVQTCAYVGMETANSGYYIGLDMSSALHPQTLLCDQMNGEPLPAAHGGPLRLVIPVKYGIKNLKWIGRIFFSNTRPRDYWTENGYDWYAGL
jgi:DMSO/TMAO reductase YedYZ molybdopterin-dependent catalytic subunit